jgi:hypothetical protein
LSRPLASLGILATAARPGAIATNPFTGANEELRIASARRRNMPLQFSASER